MDGQKPTKNRMHSREDLGFDDIPISQPGEKSLGELLRAWAIQSFHLNHPDNKLRRAFLFFRHRKFLSWKDDLKWALQADTDNKQQPPKTGQSRSARQPAVPPQTPVADTAAKSIEININFGSLPKFSRLLNKLPVRKLRLTRRRAVIAASIAFVLAGLLTWRLVQLSGTTRPVSEAGTYTKTIQSPNYPTLLPEGKTIESLGGWHRISPPDRNPVFAYADKIDEAQINVSQQPIPDVFKTNIDESVAELAKSYAATDKISLDALTIYIGTSAKGPQSVILTKGSVLILMKSTQKIDDDAWVAYVESLNLESFPASQY